MQIPTTSDRASPAPERDPALLALVFVFYYLGAKLGVVLTIMPEGIAIVWPPNAVLLAALIRTRGRGYFAIAALAAAAEILADWGRFTFAESLFFAVINVGEATIAYRLLSRWRFDPRFSTPADLWKFVAAGPVLAALAAALLGALIYTAYRGDHTAYLAFMQIWWFGDAMGLLIVTPLLLGFPPFGERDGSPTRVVAIDTAVWSAAVLVLVLFWISPDGPLPRTSFGPVLLLPFVLYAAARYPLRWATAAVAGVTLVVVTATAFGRQPFGKLNAAESAVQAQEFIFIMSVMALGLATLLNQLRVKNLELEAASRTAHEVTEQLEARVEERTLQLKHANRQLARLATVDPLTELYNRRGLIDAAEHEFALARRSGRNLAVLVADLDRFKSVNDVYGHQAGDTVLREFAIMLMLCARASDICGRWGGEEFVIVAPETDLAAAGVLAERVREAIRTHPVCIGAESISVTTSIGVTVLGDGDERFESVVQRADKALYEAKRSGRDRVVSVAPA